MSPTARYLIETLVTLVAVVGVSVLVLFFARRLGVGVAEGPLALLGRLPLDPKRAIYLVRVGKQVLVVGGSEGGLVKLGEMPLDEVPRIEPPRSFREMLRRPKQPDQAANEVDEETA